MRRLLFIMIVTMINVTVIAVRCSLCFASLAYSATGTRARVARVRAEYPNQLDYSGADICGNTYICQLGYGWAPHWEDSLHGPSSGDEIRMQKAPCCWYCDERIADASARTARLPATCTYPNHLPHSMHPALNARLQHARDER